MKLNVPYQKTLVKWFGKGVCGPIALFQVLKYYKIKSSVDELAELTNTHPKFGTPPHCLIYLAQKKGLKVEYVGLHEKYCNNRKGYSKSLKKYFNGMNSTKIDNLFLSKCKKLKGYTYIKKKPTIKVIENYLAQNKPVIALIDWSYIGKIKNAEPHYITITGTTKNNVIAHQIWPRKDKPFQKISKENYVKTWKAQGFKGNIIIAYK